VHELVILTQGGLPLHLTLWARAESFDVVQAQPVEVRMAVANL
jgi:hypothetical protein